ncbi:MULTISPECIES: hypothetical protein [Streptomyces]|uniref:Transcriptional regulator n=2 Tax=Streptomyces TaxID=1883 RepID=A0ABT9LFE9_STRGD|nr:MULTISPECIES: hypothetical protein [Streptomyces]MDP9682448.1 hypothetical protein [Streptomyces griseoviridis]GGS81366.1 hypothetical protein GCM10010240_13360 [Streptomyces griseoviridis]GGU19159.1 hypothetical protein GCM10010259_06900 [Streptomyces daghestanicus]GHI29658.1 hypothetical protein Sdagh_13880 [Streptomyces daghestanicus]
MTDAPGDRVPSSRDPALEEGGRARLIVAAYADRWGVDPTPPTKTVRAEPEARRVPGSARRPSRPLRTGAGTPGAPS